MSKTSDQSGSIRVTGRWRPGSGRVLGQRHWPGSSLPYSVAVVRVVEFGTKASQSVIIQVHILLFKIDTLTFKVLETGLPPYLSQQLCPYVPTRGLRSSSSKLLKVPRTNLRFGSRSFRVSASTIWNSIPLSVHSCKSLTTFRKHLKTLYFQSAFSAVLWSICLQTYRFHYSCPDFTYTHCCTQAGIL